MEDEVFLVSPLASNGVVCDYLREGDKGFKKPKTKKKRTTTRVVEADPDLITQPVDEDTMQIDEKPAASRRKRDLDAN